MKLRLIYVNRFEHFKMPIIFLCLQTDRPLCPDGPVWGLPVQMAPGYHNLCHTQRQGRMVQAQMVEEPAVHQQLL